ncbi:MAG: hypothetical protein IT564_10810 [Rhodospirillales bacterium]|nr:hypothetical protein [Rhodospirillales bacterium]
MPDTTSGILSGLADHPEGHGLMNLKKSTRSHAILAAGAVGFVVVAAGVVLSFRQQALDKVIRSRESQNVVLTRVLANVVWPRFADRVKRATPAGLEDLRASGAALEFGDEIAEIVRNTPVQRVKVYDVAGLTVFFSNLAQIGESRADHPPFRKAVDRQTPVSMMSFRDTFAGFAKVTTSVYLVETYVPIEGPGGEIEGIFELYTEANAAVRRIQESVIRFGAIVAAGVALLYGVLIFVVRRAQGDA